MKRNQVVLTFCVVIALSSTVLLVNGQTHNNAVPQHSRQGDVANGDVDNLPLYPRPGLTIKPSQPNLAPKTK